MRLRGGLHLAYCTNVHRGETWAETFTALEQHVLPVRQHVAAGVPYAIGLRLGARAARELSDRETLVGFQRWLERHDCYVFTINGFPYGSFHGTRVKEQVYAPDWSTPDRLEYTLRLFELLAELVPEDVAGSVSTVPGSFKGFVTAEPERRSAIFRQLTACGRAIEALARRTGRDLHLGLEPEPMCLLETTVETVDFFAEWQQQERGASALLPYVGVNYDCCHLAVEFESAGAALDRLRAAGLRLSKLHLSSALRVQPDVAGRAALEAFVEPVYLHQVVVGTTEEQPVQARYLDLPEALATSAGDGAGEWRVHFHVPLHHAPAAPLSDTRHHLIEALDWLAAHPGACQHLEMETYTWEVLPPALRLPIGQQIVQEYEWTLGALAERGLADPGAGQATRTGVGTLLGEAGV